MKVNIKKLPKGYSVVNGRIVKNMSDGGTSTGDQTNFGLVTVPPLPNYENSSDDSNDVSKRMAFSLPAVPREQANLEAEKGETVLTDMNNDGSFELYNIGGNRHHSGGTPLNLPPQSFIYSDTSRMKLNKYELAEMGIESKKKLTPAKVSKKYQLNKFIGLLDDQHTDKITADTAEYMLNKNKKSLSQLAFLQEAKKEFEDGVPLASYPYLQEKGINPLEYAQKIQGINAQEAEQQMLMQLPVEKRMEILLMKEAQEQQMQQMQQQQMMAERSNMTPQMGMRPMEQGMAPGQPTEQMMPQAPQGMTTPQQAPMPMARYGGQFILPTHQEGGEGFEDIKTATPARRVTEMTAPAMPVMAGVARTYALNDAYKNYKIGNRSGVLKNLLDASWRTASSMNPIGTFAAPYLKEYLFNPISNFFFPDDKPIRYDHDTEEWRKKYGGAYFQNGGEEDEIVYGPYLKDEVVIDGGKPGDHPKGFTQEMDTLSYLPSAFRDTVPGKKLIKSSDENKMQMFQMYNTIMNQINTLDEDAGVMDYVSLFRGLDFDMAKKIMDDAGIKSKELRNTIYDAIQYDDMGWFEQKGVDAAYGLSGLRRGGQPIAQDGTEMPLFDPMARSENYGAGNFNPIAGYDPNPMSNIMQYTPQVAVDNTYVHIPGSYVNFNQESPFVQNILAANAADNSVTDEDLPLHLRQSQILENYEADLKNAIDEYDLAAMNLMNASANRFDPASSGIQSFGAGQVNEQMVEVWKEHIEQGGSPPNQPDINYTTAYKEIYGDDAPVPVNTKGDKDNNDVGNITNVYNVQNDNDRASNNRNRQFGNIRFPGSEGVDPIYSGNEDQIFSASGLPLSFSDTQSPYYVGSQFAFANGGSYDLPQAKKGIEYKGYTYSKKELRQLEKSKDPAQRLLYAEIMNGGPIIDQQTQINNQMSNINQQRVDTEGSDEVVTYTTSGNEDWITNFEGDTEYQDQFYNEYKAYREKNNKSVLPKEEFIKNYIEFQKQNRWMNENISQEDLSNPGWDRLYEYTPCGEGESGCVTIDGKKWKKGKEKKDANWKYNQAMTDGGFEPMDKDMISHMQAGYIGGKIMELGEDDRQQFYATGVSDQEMFGLPISGDDGFWGNTTNRQLQGDKNVTPAVEANPCSNAEELQKLCADAGGVWSPYVAEVRDETTGEVTTPASGCECSKEIPKKPESEPTPKEKKADFWLQDELGIANALDAKMSLKKYYPWAPTYQNIQVDPVFKDPTREIAAIGEQAVIAANTASTFSGPQRAAAVQAKAQGVAAKQIADAVNKVQSDNVTIANQTNVKNAELEYKTQVLNNNELKQLYDNTQLTEQNYDNALREANAAITKQLQNAYTNRANTANLNSIYPQFDIDPKSGGFINITDPKSFYADPNYTDPKDSLDEYETMVNRLKKILPEEQWDKIPSYVAPDNSKAGTTTWAQDNQNTIMSTGYNTQNPNQQRYGKEVRRRNLLKKGAELRNWFSPLRGE